MRTFEDYRAAAEIYYHSPEYQSAVEALRGIVCCVRQKIIALDLEEVLTTFNLMNHTGLPMIDDLAIPDTAQRLHLRRPLANEILQFLAENGNQVIIWTTAIMQVAQEIIPLTSLSLPAQTRLIAREEFRKELLAQGLVKEDTVSSALPYKIPSVFGVDVLLDDQAEQHREGCYWLGRASDARKILKVKEFEVLDRKDLENFHKDRGLLAAAKSLADFFQQAE